MRQYSLHLIYICTDFYGTIFQIYRNFDQIATNWFRMLRVLASDSPASTRIKECSRFIVQYALAAPVLAHPSRRRTPIQQSSLIQTAITESPCDSRIALALEERLHERH